MVNCRSKGARGEREFCTWLESTFDLPEKPKRNLEQVRSGGSDVHLYPFVFEVKRVEKLHLQKWWLQVVAATKNGDIPVVAFRQNNFPWEFLIPAKEIGLKYGYIRLREKEFVEWVTITLSKYDKFNI